MADRTSAGVFGKIFDLLAKDPTEEHRSMASEVYEFIRDYDFRPYQMYCDESLVKLGLATLGIDPEYPEDGEVYIYQ